MKNIVLTFGICILMVGGTAIAANGQFVANAQTACQKNPTQCSQAKAATKAQAQKEMQSAKNACNNNKSACNNAKSAVKNTVNH